MVPMEVLLYWFIKYLFPLIEKDVATTMLQIEQEDITKAQHSNLIYSLFGYLYAITPDAHMPLPFHQEIFKASHRTDGLIRSMTQLHPYVHPTPS